MDRHDERSGKFAFWYRYLLIISALFGLQAVTWLFFGSFDPLGVYTGLLADALFGVPRLPQEARVTLAFATGPLGATTAGFWVLVHALVRHGFSRRDRWSYRAVVSAVLVWFTLDSVASVAHGAWFNVLLVNIPCLLLIGVGLIRVRPYVGRSTLSSGRATGRPS